jgi:regulator of protease activity HflC (stomatin/prohibitin superfamily)
MMAMTILTITLILIAAATIGGIKIIKKKLRRVVPEDHVAVTVNKDGFVKRVLPGGRYFLRPSERIDFLLETKTRLASNTAPAIATSDGIAVKFNWSGTYALRPDLITENRSQRLRGLQNAEKAMARNVDILLRQLVGHHPVSDLFHPATRQELEQQVNERLIERLKPMGIAFNGLNLQTIELPGEVSEALNKAKAIETLDNAIRHLDPTTREVVRGVYHLDEILHWDQYLPVPSRQTLQKLQQS